MRPPVSFTTFEGHLGIVDAGVPHNWLLRAHLLEPSAETGQTDRYLMPAPMPEPWEPELGELLAAVSEATTKRLAEQADATPNFPRENFAAVTAYRLEVAGRPAATFARYVGMTPSGCSRWLIVEDVVGHAIYGEAFIEPSELQVVPHPHRYDDSEGGLEGD